MSVSNPTLQNQIEACKRKQASMEKSAQMVQEKLDVFEKDALRLGAQMEAFQGVYGLIQKEHVQGLKDAQERGDLSEEEVQQAMRWIREISGIPVNLTDQARLKKAQAEGGALACRKMLETFKQASREEAVRIKELQGIGNKVDGLDQRKSENPNSSEVAGTAEEIRTA